NVAAVRQTFLIYPRKTPYAYAEWKRLPALLVFLAACAIWLRNVRVWAFLAVVAAIAVAHDAYGRWKAKRAHTKLQNKPGFFRELRSAFLRCSSVKTVELTNMKGRPIDFIRQHLRNVHIEELKVHENQCNFKSRAKILRMVEGHKITKIEWFLNTCAYDYLYDFILECFQMCEEEKFLQSNSAGVVITMQSNGFG
ncbi:hypothetical protein PFISCL1PPCAC_3736, partial [Pristionchus fissidentatus]